MDARPNLPAPAVASAVLGATRHVVRRACLARHEYCVSADFAGVRCPALDCFALAAYSALLRRSDHRLGGAVLARPRRGFVRGAPSGPGPAPLISFGGGTRG